ncbi:MAG: pyruvate kinase, partial [Clostridia bacterium]|nr:pyruvate kinase [Clostridia bacterium]
MRKTKIICTVGPACSDEATLEQMFLSGMNVARLNFSHGSHEDHLAHITRIKKIREKLELPIAIMLDTKGPEYRIKTFEHQRVDLKEGATFTFTTDDVIGNEERVSVNYQGLPNEMELGDIILLNNGLLSFRVTAINGNDIVCEVVDGGILSDRKSMSFPGKVLGQPYLSEQDKSDLLFGIQNDVDFIACSFVSCKQDLLDIHEFLNANGGEGISLIAKIENRAGIDNIEDICSVCDGIMIGRG